MRDPNRIPIILAELQKIWEAHPDMRLGQLLENILPPLELSDLYNIEDDKLIAFLDAFYDFYDSHNKK